MKGLIFFLFVFLSPAYSQSKEEIITPKNPDGETMSIHFTPYWIDGKIDRRTFESEFSFKAEFWLPVNEYITVKLIHDQTNAGALILNKTGLTFSYYFE